MVHQLAPVKTNTQTKLALFCTYLQNFAEFLRKLWLFAIQLPLLYCIHLKPTDQLCWFLYETMIEEKQCFCFKTLNLILSNLFFHLKLVTGDALIPLTLNASCVNFVSIMI